MDDYADIIARLEKATGPDRELDAAIEQLIADVLPHLQAPRA